MLVDNPVSSFAFSPTDLSEYLHADLFTPSIPSSSSAGSSSSRASSPQSPFQSLLTPPQSSLPTSFPDVYDSPNSNNFFNFLEDELKLVEPFPTSSAPYDFVGALSTSSTPDMQATFAIDPQLMTTSSSKTEETDEEELSNRDAMSVTIAPIKVGGHGKARKGTVQSGGIVKKSPSMHPPATVSKAVSSTSSKENDNMDDDDFLADWRPPPEVYAKMSSKEKRQLRNKISARNFRVRRKEYISTLELDIAERDRLLQAIRTELGSSQSENHALRQEITALKKALLEGRATSELTVDDIPVLNLPPPGPIPQPATPPTSFPSLITPNTQKDLASSHSGGFWGGVSRMGGGVTPVHTVLIPEVACGRLQENINPTLNGKDKPRTPAFGMLSGFDGFADGHLFTLKSLDSYRMQLWTKMASQQAPHPTSSPISVPSSPPTPNPLFSPSPFTNPSLPYLTGSPYSNSTSLHGLASSLGPKFFQASNKAHLPPAQDRSPLPMLGTTLSTLLAGKYHPSSPSSTRLLSVIAKDQQREKEQQQQAMIAALAGQTLLKRLGSAFWDAFAGGGGSSPGNASSSVRIDTDKVRRVLEGKAVVKVVDIEEPNAPRKEVGGMRRRTEPKSEPKDVCLLLEESMRNLTLGKK
ncbi:uncharacterized protein BT62DRAFT_931875 [Guyanagaster necrorhizus]|uniref:BZIP domain-containing protein n=1 Tax=Guyanagaster necrorhizus TaxID=856835 RepID=A0A9P7VTJ8_9AGAR|nr:uncharacterized protein BT62DRAFT_931875 [Guyanagaster necrorhizus MCA 3950]KAG7446440.1 hypothetical protein BT62DRAFT_931875 [Guyanagaster necrorhizus MCA 3950]